MARVLRGNATAAVENVALWHERDISHSGAERVILPDSTILLDYLQHLAIRVVQGMVVHEDRMRENLDLTYGALFSQRVLLALVSGGMTRDEAYRVAQELAQRAWDERVHLRELLEVRPELGLDLDTIFDLGHYARYAKQIVGRLPLLPPAEVREDAHGPAAAAVGGPDGPPCWCVVGVGACATRPSRCNRRRWACRCGCCRLRYAQSGTGARWTTWRRPCSWWRSRR